MRLLLDEHISPTLVARLADLGVYAQARDFIELLNVEVHPGLVVLRESGLTREEQWLRIRPVIEEAKNSNDEDFFLNKLIEIKGVGKFEVRSIARD